MAVSGDSMQPETPKSPYLNSHLNSNDEAFDPMIADSMANCDYKVEGDGVGFHSNSNGEFALNVEASPLQNPIDFRSDRTCKSGTDNQWDLSSEGPTEYPNALFDPKGKNLRIRGDLGVDLESGREISGNGGSFWSSTRRLLGKAWNRFARGDFIRTFNGSIPATRTVESHFSFNPKLALAKPAAEPVKSANPDSKRGEKPRDTGPVGSAKSGNENIRAHMKPSGKKPPKPPRAPRSLTSAATDTSKEKLMKGISDIALLRKAKLERIRSLKKKQAAKAKASNANVWALVFTLCFCLIMIVQGIFSQGNASPQISPGAPMQTRKFSLEFNKNYRPNSTNREPGLTIGKNQPSDSLSDPEPGIDEVTPVPPNLGS